MDEKRPDKVRQEIGGDVPDIALRSIDGSARDLGFYLQGKQGAVVAFWSETCSHCVRYDSYLNGFSARHPQVGLMVIASRQGETADVIRKAAATRKLEFPIHHDPDGEVARQWHTQQTPRVFLINAQRKLLYRGAIDNFKFPGDPEFEAYLEPAVEAFLAGKPIARPETASFGCAVRSVYYILPKPL